MMRAVLKQTSRVVNPAPVGSWQQFATLRALSLRQHFQVRPAPTFLRVKRRRPPSSLGSSLVTRHGGSPSDVFMQTRRPGPGS
jgi:hypothetical protein